MMTIKEAGEVLNNSCKSVHMLLYKGKLEHGATCHEVTDESVARHLVMRRPRRKNNCGGKVLTAKHIPDELLRKFRATVPKGRSFVECLIEAMERWMKEKGEVAMTSTITVSDIFEIAGEFSPELRARFDALELRVIDAKAEELVRYELELVEDLCTNTSASLTEEHLLRVVVFLNAKLDSLQ